MKNQRHHARHYVGLALALVALLSAATLPLGPERRASAQGVTASWSHTGSLNTSRYNHTATLLPNGKVLVAGGSGLNASRNYVALNSAELYDPATGVWSYTGDLVTARHRHTATLLPSGKVLVAGGVNHPDTGGVLNSAELYDPTTETWSNTGYLNGARHGHTSTLLPNGEVLAVGGSSDIEFAVQRAELYDSASGTWRITGNLNMPRVFPTATLLPDGKVLVVGGYNSCPNDNCLFLNTSELYNPATGTWSYTGNLNAARTGHTATLLPNGKVLVAGNYQRCGDVGCEDTLVAELYHPTTGIWSEIGDPGIYDHTATLLPNGYVLVVRDGTFAQLYDPATETFSITANANTERYSNTATLLPNGKVLVAAGFDGSGIVNSAELYDPGAGANSIDSVDFFVRQQYRDFLGREPDPIGFQNWTDTLTKCPNGGHGEFENPDCDRVHVSAGFFQSNEFLGRGYWILRFGYVGLNRSVGSKRSSATYAEFVPALQQVGGSNSPAQEEAAKVAYTNAFVQRSDFQALFPNSMSNSSYVSALEANAGVTLSNKQALIDALNNLSMTRADVLRNVVESQVVFDKYLIPAFVTMEYFGYLRRDPDTIGYQNWVNTLTADPSNYRHMIFGFIYSKEYRERFGQP